MTKCGKSDAATALTSLSCCCLCKGNHFFANHILQYNDFSVHQKKPRFVLYVFLSSTSAPSLHRLSTLSYKLTFFRSLGGDFPIQHLVGTEFHDSQKYFCNMLILRAISHDRIFQRQKNETFKTDFRHKDTGNNCSVPVIAVVLPHHLGGFIQSSRLFHQVISMVSSVHFDGFVISLRFLVFLYPIFAYSPCGIFLE